MGKKAKDKSKNMFFNPNQKSADNGSQNDFLLSIMNFMESLPYKKRQEFLNLMMKGADLAPQMSDSFEESEDLDEEEEFDDYDSEFDFQYYKESQNVKKFTLKISLKNISPSIWRKIEVPSNITLRYLSELFLMLMGWEAEHMNQFRKGNNYYAPAYQRVNELPDMFGKTRNFNQEDFIISDILQNKGNTCTWEYDFGDSWEHEIKVMAVDEYAADEPRKVVFKGGKRACPPEDCGGVWGYEDLLVLWQKMKSHKKLSSEERDRLEWYQMDKDFDPEYLDIEECEDIVKDFNEDAECAKED